MIQLKWDKNFKDVIEDYEEAIMEKLPSFLDDFVVNHFKSRAIRYWDLNDETLIYCPKCFNTLNSNYSCSKCETDYKFNPKLLAKIIDDDYIDFTDFDCTNKNNYRLFYFDVEHGNAILYMIDYHLYINIPDKSFSLYRKRANEFHINEDGISLPDGNLYSILDFITNPSFEKGDYINLIYKDNLDILKNSGLYRYSYLWELKEVFNITIDFQPNINNLIEYPLIHPEFEYLVKHGFYYMALNETDDICFNGNFKDTFHVEKSKLKYFDYTSLSLSHLWLINEFNIKSKKKLHELALAFNNLANKDLAIEYVKQKKLNARDVFNYLDYLEICWRFLMTFKSNSKIRTLVRDKKSIFYPKDYKNRKNEFYSYFKDQIEKINNWYEKQYNILNINSYEDEEYIIRPLENLDDLFQEAASQHNCLESYIDFQCKGLYQLYFMRKKDNPNKSFITIEVNDDHIVQALAKFNKEPEDKIKKILKLWESRLVKVEFER